MNKFNSNETPYYVGRLIAKLKSSNNDTENYDHLHSDQLALFDSISQSVNYELSWIPQGGWLLSEKDKADLDLKISMCEFSGYENLFLPETELGQKLSNKDQRTEVKEEIFNHHTYPHLLDAIHLDTIVYEEVIFKGRIIPKKSDFIKVEFFHFLEPKKRRRPFVMDHWKFQLYDFYSLQSEDDPRLGLSIYVLLKISPDLTDPIQYFSQNLVKFIHQNVPIHPICAIGRT